MVCRQWPLVVIAIVGCDPPPPTFDPRVDFEYITTAGPDPNLNLDFDSVARTSLYVPPGEMLRGERYEVPGYNCLRVDDTDWNDLPAGATGPGESAHFEVLYPLAGTDAGILVFMPHGDGLEFIESLALEIYKLDPLVAATFGVDPVNGTRGVEQSTRYGGKRNMVGTGAGRSAITLARLGATVVIPGNCWGDGGHGTGQNGDGYFDGRRYGGSFDHDVLAWARATLAHDPAKVVAVGCSGGGHRIAEELIRDPDAFRAAIIDSPADNTRGFLTDPRPRLLGDAETLLRTELFDSLMSQYFIGTFGGNDQAAQASLGAALPNGLITIPIYFTYSTNDPLVTPPVVQGLIDAMAVRPAPSMMVPLDLAQHCQLNTDDRMRAATDWLSSVLPP